MTNKSFGRACRAVAIISSLLLVLLGCQQKHESKSTQSGLADLKLESMTIHGESVASKAVTVHNKTITGGDISATFSYGDVSGEPITVTVKGGTFECDVAKPKVLELSVPAKPGKYNAWSDKITVTYVDVAQPLKLQNLLIHGYNVEKNAVKVKQDAIEAKDIQAFFDYGSVKGRKLDVVVEGGKVTVAKTGVTKLKLSVPPVEGEYKEWKGEIDVTYDGTLLDPLSLVSMKIHGHTVNVNDLTVTLSAASISASDIEAEFKHGATTETIAVVVEGAPVTVNKTGSTTLKLSVPKSGSYEGWKGEVTVRYSENKLQLVSMNIGGNEVDVNGGNKAYISIPRIRKEHITAIFRDPATSVEKEYEVDVPGGEFKITASPIDMPLSVKSEAGKHDGWTGSVKLTYKYVTAGGAIIANYDVNGQSQPKIAIDQVFQGVTDNFTMKGPSFIVLVLSQESNENKGWKEVKLFTKDVDAADWETEDDLTSLLLEGVAPQVGGPANCKHTLIFKPLLPDFGKTKLYNFRCISEEDGNCVKELRFNVTREAGTVDMPIELHIAGQEQKGAYGLVNDSSKTYEMSVLGKTSVPVQVVSTDDVMNNATIDGKSVNVTPPPPGKKNYEIMSMVDGLTESGKDFDIVITPKDTAVYHNLTYKLKIKNENSVDNTDFKLDAKGNPIAGADKKKSVWYHGKEPGYIDDYGCKKAVLFAATASEKSKVYYKILDRRVKGTFTEDDRTGGTLMTFDAITKLHTSAEITVKENLPTSIYFWVESESGKKAPLDSVKGNFFFNLLNPVNLCWDYADKAAIADYANKDAYAEITVQKSSLAADKKVHLVFSCWKEAYGYSIFDGYDWTQYAHQTKPAKFGTPADHWQDYKVVVDVSALADGSKDELEVVFPIAEGSENCFTYKLKVKAE